MENQTVPNPTPEPVVSQVPVVEPKRKFPVMYLVLLLLSLGLLASTAFLYYQNQQLKTILASYQTQTVATPTPSSQSPSPTLDPAANWKTYTNDTYKLSFKYPSNLNIEINQVDTANYVQVIFDKSSNNSFNIKASVKYPINQPKFLLDTESTGTKNINGKLWSVFELPNGSLGMQLEENSILYSVIYPVSEGTVVDQILSTFQFTK